MRRNSWGCAGSFAEIEANRLREDFMKTFFAGLLAILPVLFMGGCSQGDSLLNTARESDDINAEMLERLLNKRIYFGHKSVGYNILQGIQEIKDKDARFQRLAVVEMEPENRAAFDLPGIYHQQNGKNGFPKGKCDAFKHFLMENENGSHLDIAFFKFCYVDFAPDTNVPEIFGYYVETMESIKKSFPNLTLVHFTVPLMAHRWGGRSIIRNFTKGDQANVIRNEFNRMLIDKYGDRETIYDLAALESTYPDGKRESFKENGREYYSLIRDYTHDGGHLNATGRYYAARQLLAILSDIDGN